MYALTAHPSFLLTPVGRKPQTTLTNADQRKLRELNKSIIPALNSRLKAAYDALEVAADRRTKLLSILNESLKRRRDVRSRVWLFCWLLCWVQKRLGGGWIALFYFLGELNPVGTGFKF